MVAKKQEGINHKKVVSEAECVLFFIQNRDVLSCYLYLSQHLHTYGL